MFRALFSDRRLWLLLVLAVVAWVLGRHILPAKTALMAVIKTGYWCMLATFVWWLHGMWRLRRRDGWRLPQDARSWGLVALVIAGGLLWQAHETHGYKILADEYQLTGTAQVMHLEREVGYPLRGSDLQGPFRILESTLDKRPYFFPFLVSLAHDLTGYRVENAFWLNTLLGFVLLGLVYLLGARAGDSRRAGVLALLLAIGLPLLSQQAAGAGFELLNLVFIAGWWLLCIRVLDAPGPEAQDAFLLTSVLLASTRYESLWFLLPTALVLLTVWCRTGLRITAVTWAAPFLVVPMLWLNRAFTFKPELWQMASRDATAPFALEYIPANLGHALKYFFTFDGYQPNSPFLAALGLLALPLFALWAQRILRSPRGSRGDEAGLALGAIGPLGITALLMVYFWGQFDHPVIRRLSLPTQLLLIVAAVVVAGRVIKSSQRVWNGLVAAAALALIAYSIPVMAKNAYGRDYAPSMAHAFRREFLARQPLRDFLVIDQDTGMWLAERLAATPVGQAKARSAGIAYHLRNRSFSAVYVFQAFDVNPDTGALTVDPADDLGPAYELEQVEQRRVSLLRIARISRVTAIREGGKELARVEPTARVIRNDASEQEMEEAKKAYLERWLRELP